MPMTRPPIAGHHIQWIGSLRERVFRRVDRRGEQRRQRAGEQADDHAADEAGEADVGRMRRHRKDRPEPEDVAARGGRRDARERDRNQAARLPLEQQQLDGEQHRRDRRGEGRRHAGRRARDEQRLALGAGQMEELRDQRSERAAGHDDRPFGAERAARSDRDRRRQRLEQRHLRLTRLPFIRIASIASGMPWPRIRSEP